MIDVIEGVVTTYAEDLDGTTQGWQYGAFQGPWIGEILVAYVLENNWSGKTVWVALADQDFTGSLEASYGVRGWSEWTPAESSECKVGGHDLIQIIEAHDGEHVKLIISDEGPINPLEIAEREPSQ